MKVNFALLLFAAVGIFFLGVAAGQCPSLTNNAMKAKECVECATTTVQTTGQDSLTTPAKQEKKVVRDMKNNLHAPKSRPSNVTDPIYCVRDSDCQKLKYWQNDQRGMIAMCVLQSPWTGGVCEVGVAEMRVITAPPPWSLGIGCNFASDPDTSCDDGNACTTDYCNPYYYGGQGGCAHPESREQTTCGTDGCVFQKPLCMDYKVNTQTCDEFLQNYVGHTCDDGDPCTTSDQCAFKDGTFKCLGGPRTPGCN